MSESNNKKKKSKFLVLILIYTIIAILITTYLILFYKKNNVSAFKYYSYKWLGEKIIDNDNNKSDLIDKIKSIDDEEIDRVSLSDRYALNNLTFNEIIEYKGDSIEYSLGDDTNGRLIEIKYLQIEGLKNKNIQNKINNDIKDHVYEKLDEIYKYIDENSNKKINNTYINTYIGSSYSDILSIYINKCIIIERDENENENDYEYNQSENIDDYVYLNYRLDTGDYIEFKDCFTKDANIKQMLIQNYYKNRVWNYRDSFFNDDASQESEIYFEDIDMDKRNYGEIEDDLLKLVLDYEKNKNNISFIIMESYLSCIFDDYYITIPMYENYEYIDIAKKYLSSNSLYEDGDLEKENYIYSVPIYGKAIYYDFISSNSFLSVINTDYFWRDSYKVNYAVESDNIDDTNYDEINRIVDKLKQYLIQNDALDSKKGYIYYMDVFKDYNNNYKDKYYFNVERIEIENKDFKERVQDINYRILHNISEGYIGLFNLDSKEVKQYNFTRYGIFENSEGNFQIENNYEYDEFFEE